MREMQAPSPNLGAIITIPHQPVSVSADAYPWINVPSARVPAVEVTLPGGATFVYGSIIGLNNTITKLADSVPRPDSNTAQAVMFAGLSDVLTGLPHQGIGKVENAADACSSTLFIASRNITRFAGLVFAVEPSANKQESPVVLRVGISSHSSHFRLLGIMGIRPTSGHRRRG